MWNTEQYTISICFTVQLVWMWPKIAIERKPNKCRHRRFPLHRVFELFIQKNFIYTRTHIHTHDFEYAINRFHSTTAVAAACELENLTYCYVLAMSSNSSETEGLIFVCIDFFSFGWTYPTWKLLVSMRTSESPGETLIFINNKFNILCMRVYEEEQIQFQSILLLRCFLEGFQIPFLEERNHLLSLNVVWYWCMRVYIIFFFLVYSTPNKNDNCTQCHK